jgi:hypothetical protein
MRRLHSLWSSGARASTTNAKLLRWRCRDGLSLRVSCGYRYAVSTAVITLPLYCLQCIEFSCIQDARSCCRRGCRASQRDKATAASCHSFDCGASSRKAEEATSSSDHISIHDGR